MRRSGVWTGTAVLAWSAVVSGVSVVSVASAGTADAAVAAAPRAASPMAIGRASAVPTPLPVPGGPALTSLQGKTANGIQGILTVPAQLPLDPPTQPLARRVIDAGIANVSGTAPVTGDLQVTLTALPSAAAGAVEFPQTLQQYSDTAGAWQTVPVPANQGATWTHTYAGVTVPVGGSVVERFRLSAGSAPLGGIKVTVSLDGATETTTIPVPAMSFAVTGLPATLQSGVAAPFTGTLTNPTDVPYSGVGFTFSALGCSGCLRAQDVVLEYQTGGVWTPIALQAGPGGIGGTIGGGISVPAAASVQIPLRITAGDAAAAAGPLQISVQPNGLPVSVPPAPQNVAVTPGAGLSSGVRTDPSPATPSDSASSASPSASDASSAAAPLPSASASGSTSATDGSSTAVAGVSTGGGAGLSANAAILGATGALVVSIALLGWYFIRRTKHPVPAAAPAPQYPHYDHDDYADHSTY